MNEGRNRKQSGRHRRQSITCGRIVQKIGARCVDIGWPVVQTVPITHLALRETRATEAAAECVQENVSLERRQTRGAVKKLAHHKSQPELRR